MPMKGVNVEYFISHFILSEIEVWLLTPWPGPLQSQLQYSVSRARPLDISSHELSLICSRDLPILRTRSWTPWVWVRGRDINTVGGEHLHHNWAGAPQRRTHGQGWYYFVAITKFSWSWMFSKWQPIIILFSPHSVVDGELDSRLPTPFYLLFMALSRLLQVTRLLNKSWHFTSLQTTRLLHHIISCHHNRTKLRH